MKSDLIACQVFVVTDVSTAVNISIINRRNDRNFNYNYILIVIISNKNSFNLFILKTHQRPACSILFLEACFCTCAAQPSVFRKNQQ